MMGESSAPPSMPNLVPVPERCRHLGDGVYATYDGYGIEIRVNDHRSEQVAYMEPQIVRALSQFLDQHQECVARAFHSPEGDAS